MKTLFITGGRGEIGQAIVAEFQAANYQVFAPTSADLNLQDSVAIEQYIRSLDAVDAFVHCAGINFPKPFAEIASDEFMQTLTINALAFYSLTQALVRHSRLQENGHILAISSIYGDISRKGRFSYTASKYCLNGMVKNLALELGQQKIKVNALAPGFVETSLTRRNNSAAIIAQMEKAIPLGQLAAAADIAKIAYFLASKDNRYVNGQIIIADGGYTAGGFQE